ncbi:hypothetical protein DFQ28_005924 [Apophysomyces sp. BC1034]|nr:hypothetical protein DFQ30_005839 [Apophysomyces sp. BC1015]KAG0177433.1 hypothetical protein DFQ29_004826 [Apophysomyces sp. BC1021]KAG0187729.1 hypothetical protein DFQ28_005924 [Apophysomyces sp. BC1034]
MLLHPLLQGVLNEPRLSANRLSIILLPPYHYVQQIELSFDFLASHVIPLSSSAVIASTSATLQRTTAIATTNTPQPRHSLSASSVFSRIKSPRAPVQQKYSDHDEHEVVLATVNDKPVAIRNNIITILNKSACITHDVCLYAEDGDAVKHVLLYLDSTIVPCDDHHTKEKNIPRKIQPTFKDILLKHQGDALNRLVQEFCDTVMEIDDREQLQQSMDKLLAQGYNLVLETDIQITTSLDIMYSLDFVQVGLPPIPNGRKRVQSAIDVFEKIGSFRTPAEKLDCLLTTVNQLMQQQMEEGRYGFALSTFEAVLHYIKESSHQLIEVVDQNMAFWSALRSGDEKAVAHFYRTPELFSTICGAQDDKGNDALLIACSTGQANIVDYILQKQPTRIVNNRKQTPLMMAIQARSPETVTVLLRDDHVLKTINEKDVDGNTAFLIACTLRTDEFFTALLNKGAQLNISNNSGDGPFHIVCKHPSAEAVHALLNVASTTLSWQNHNGATFFHLCDDPQLFKEAIDNPYANLDTTDINGKTPLLLWAAKGRLDIIELLMGCEKVDRYRLDGTGKSALHLIAQHLASGLVFGERGLEDVLRYFKILVNVRNTKGDTALHIAAGATANWQLASRLIQCLVHMGASMDILNQRGTRPSCLCKSPELANVMDGIPSYPI